MTATSGLRAAGSLATPLLALALIGFGAFAVLNAPVGADTIPDRPPTVAVAPGEIVYREAGQFSVEGHDIDAPQIVRQIDVRLDVMKFQVSVADYQLCVEAGACTPLDGRKQVRTDMPVTGVSYLDASAYARWYAGATGENWRLPTDAEWVHFARIGEDARTIPSEGQSRADRWLAEYRQMAVRSTRSDPAVRPHGAFGHNEIGIADIGGNVWEWTDTCLERVVLNAAGNVMSRLDNCGVRVLQGQHRTYVSAFIRDAIAGACAAGQPPDNLGFRLVREHGWREAFGRWARAVLP